MYPRHGGYNNVNFAVKSKAKPGAAVE